MNFIHLFSESAPDELDGLMHNWNIDIDEIREKVISIESTLSTLDVDNLNNRISSVQNMLKFFHWFQVQQIFQCLYLILRSFGLTGKEYDDPIPLYKVSLKVDLSGYDSWSIPDMDLLQSLSEVEEDTSGISVTTPFSTNFGSENPLSFYGVGEISLTFEKTFSSGVVDYTSGDVSSALANLVDWFDTQFGLDDLVKGEPYSLPPANAGLATQAILSGVGSFAVSQAIPLGTFAMQALEQFQMQKLNYVQDVQFQLIIAIFKTLIANQWPKGDLSELLASFSGLDTGLEYRAKINDHWLNQSLTRALNSFTDETEYPLDTPSVSKVVAEKTDLLGVEYGNFKKMFPFETVSGDIFYLTEEMTITPWPKQFFFIQE